MKLDKVLGLILIIRASWLLYRYVIGMGAKYYHVPGYLENYNKQNNWFVRFMIWNSSLIWLGTQKNASKSQRVYLLTTSILMLIAGLLLLFKQSICGRD